MTREFGCQPFAGEGHRESVKASELLPVALPLPRRLRSAAGRVHRWLPRTYPLVRAVFAGFGAVALLVTMQSAGAPLWAVNAAMLLPGVFCFVLVPSSRRRWYRWVVLLALAQVVYPWVTAPLLLVGISWAWYRTEAERPAKTTGDDVVKTTATAPAKGKAQPRSKATRPAKVTAS